MEGDRVFLPGGRLELCADLCRRGVLQSVASRNRQEDVFEKLHQFDLEPYFLAVKADLLSPKSVMVMRIMDDLGLVRNSDVVFLDDDRFNVEEVITNCPNIGWAGSFEDFVPLVNDLFSKPEYTEEDRGRVASYRAEQERKKSAVGYGEEYSNFLKSCDMSLEISAAVDADLPRAADLIERSNQFNTAAQRDVTPYMLRNGELGKVLIGHVKDRFGDYGISAVLCAEKRILLSLVISCRLQGKGIGTALLGGWINNHLGFSIQARLENTPYNGQMKNLFSWCGFAEVSPGYYARISADPVDLPDWVDVIWK